MAVRRAPLPWVDVALALALVLWGVAEALSFASAAPAAARVALAVAATAPVALRSIAPLSVAAWLVATFLLDTVAVVLPVDAVTPLPSVPVAVYGLVVCGVSRRLALLVGVLAVPGLPAATAIVARDAPVTTGDAVALGVAVGVAALAGAVVRARREAADRARRAAAAARAAREQGLRAGVLAERLRIAGELRAIVSRDLGDMAVRLSRATPDAAALVEVADGVQRVAAEAVVEMQRLLRVLRAVAADPPPDHGAVGVGVAHGDGRPQARTAGASPARAPRAADAAVLVLAGAAVSGEALASGSASVAVVLATVGALIVGPLALRRRAPLPAALALAAGQVVTVLAGVLPDRPLSTVPVAVLGAAAVARHALTGAHAVMGGTALVGAVVGVTAMTLGHPTPATDLPIVTYLVVGGWLVGWRARTAEGSMVRVRANEARAAAEHGARVQEALDEVRRGVARELHDVVAHGVSLVAVLAGAARTTAHRDPARSRADLVRAAEVVVDTRRELARLTAMLRTGATEPPALALRDLELLAAQARAGGQEVRLTGTRSVVVPPGVAASAYRIVQEAVTNARKHARGQAVTIDVECEGDAVIVTVVNPADRSVPPGCGSGLGIAGMRERARLLDGELSAGWRADRCFVVRARLPVDPRSRVPAPEQASERDASLMDWNALRIK